MTASRPKPLSMNQMLRLVDRFNAQLPVGSAVEYRSHPDAVPELTKVRGEAFILSGHTPCAFVENRAGCVFLRALRAAKVTEPSDSEGAEAGGTEPRPPLCADCRQPTLAHHVVAEQFYCGNAGCREYLITRSAREIDQFRKRLTFKPAAKVVYADDREASRR